MQGLVMDNTALFYTCSLVEYIGRVTKNDRAYVVRQLGNDLERIYKYQDVFHCEPIEKIADEFIQRAKIQMGTFDNVASCKYSVPDYWDIGEVFQRLIEDTSDEENIVDGIKKVFSSWIAEKILNCNSDLYYQPRDYLAECYREGVIIPA
jgi:hypothetical protein